MFRYLVNFGYLGSCGIFPVFDFLWEACPYHCLEHRRVHVCGVYSICLCTHGSPRSVLWMATGNMPTTACRCIIEDCTYPEYAIEALIQCLPACFMVVTSEEVLQVRRKTIKPAWGRGGNYNKPMVYSLLTFI